MASCSARLARARRAPSASSLPRCSRWGSSSAISRRGGVPELLLNHGIDAFGSRRQQGGFEEVEGLQLGLPAIGAQLLLAQGRLAPAGRDRDQLLVQSGCPGTVEAESPHQDDSGDGVVALSQAGPGEVVVDESLGGEPTEQAPDDAVLQVEVDDVLVHGSGVVEDDRTDRRLPSPFPGLLIALARRPKRVHRLGPRRIGPLALIEGGELEAVDGDVPVVPSRKWLQGVGVHHLQGAGDGGAEMVLTESDDQSCDVP